MTWRHGAVLVLALAAIQASTFASYRTNLFLRDDAIEAAGRPSRAGTVLSSLTRALGLLLDACARQAGS
ncbi:MAG: hypothetical protein ACRDRJ_16975 [Streptosporangiaceae bacterium]